MRGSGRVRDGADGPSRTEGSKQPAQREAHSRLRTCVRRNRTHRVGAGLHRVGAGLPCVCASACVRLLRNAAAPPSLARSSVRV
jgi:hypothetical protein